MTRGALGVALLAGAVSGCDDGQPEVRYQPYTGDAYPSRELTFPRAEGVLAITSDNGSDTLTLLDLPSGRRLGQVPVGRDPVSIDGPHHLAVDRAARVLYVALNYPPLALSPGPHASHFSSQRSGYVQRVSLDTFAILDDARVDENPGEIIFVDALAKAVVSHFDVKRSIDVSKPAAARRSQLAFIDAGPVPTVARAPVCMAGHGMAAVGERLFVACYGEDAIASVDGRSPSSQPTLHALPGASTTPGAPALGPYSVVASASGDRLAVGQTEGKVTTLFDVAAATFTLSMKTQGAPYFAAWSADSSRLFVPTQAPDAIVVFDPATGSVVTSRTFAKGECQRPHEAVTTEGALAVVCEGDHVAPGRVLVLDPVTLSTTAEADVGVYPDRLLVVSP